MNSLNEDKHILTKKREQRSDQEDKDNETREEKTIQQPRIRGLKTREVIRETRDSWGCEEQDTGVTKDQEKGR